MCVWGGGGGTYLLVSVTDRTRIYTYPDFKSATSAYPHIAYWIRSPSLSGHRRSFHLLLNMTFLVITNNYLFTK